MTANLLGAGGGEEVDGEGAQLVAHLGLGQGEGLGVELVDLLAAGLEGEADAEGVLEVEVGGDGGVAGEGGLQLVGQRRALLLAAAGLEGGLHHLLLAAGDAEGCHFWEGG